MSKLYRLKGGRLTLRSGCQDAIVAAQGKSTDIRSMALQVDIVKLGVIFGIFILLVDVVRCVVGFDNVVRQRDKDLDKPRRK